MTEEGESDRKEGRSPAATHNALCAVAVRWLRKHNSAGGHGCSVAQTECYPGWRGGTARWYRMAARGLPGR